MSDALALPFSVSGVNSGGYKIVAAMNLYQNQSYTIAASEFDIGCIINGSHSTGVLLCPIYFSPYQNVIYTIRSGIILSNGTFGNSPVLTIQMSGFEAYNINSLSMSIMLFKAPE